MSRVHSYGEPHRDEAGKVIAVRVHCWNAERDAYDVTTEPLTVGQMADKPSRPPHLDAPRTSPPRRGRT